MSGGFLYSWSWGGCHVWNGARKECSGRILEIHLN